MGTIHVSCAVVTVSRGKPDGWSDEATMAAALGSAGGMSFMMNWMLGHRDALKDRHYTMKGDPAGILLQLAAERAASTRSHLRKRLLCGIAG